MAVSYKKREGKDSKMKKILSIFVFAFALVCALTSCNLPFLPGGETTATTPQATTPEPPTETTTEKPDETTVTPPEETTVTTPEETTVTTPEETTVTTPEETTVTTPEETTPEQPHAHSWSEWIVVKEAKCEEKGLLQRYCTECNYTESKPIDALGHTEVIDEAVAPTCTETGLTEGKHCSICNEVFIAQVVIEATGHSFSEWVTTKEPTEAEEGLMERLCTCGEKETQRIEKLQPSVGLEYTLNNDGVSYSVTGIGNCTDTDIVIPTEYEGLPVTTIGNSAFRACSKLTSVTIPDSVTTIGSSAFWRCSNLTSVTIPDSVTTIGGSAFRECSNLTSVTIPDSVTTIGGSAFYGCSNLTSVTIGNAHAIVGLKAFSGCNSALYTDYQLGRYVGDSTNPYAILVEMTNKNLSIYQIHPDTKIIAGGVFSSCGRLTNITIPNGVRTIGGSAFYNCGKLTSVTIPDSVITIGDYAFYYCTNLTSVTIGDSVTTIGGGAFYKCSNLTRFVVVENNTAYQSINGNLYSKDGTVLVAYACGKTVTSFVVPNIVTTIGDSAFYDCDNLTSVTIGNSVTTIGDYAFCECNRLTSVTIPDSVTTIGNWAFYYCTNLTSVTIPDSVTTIGEDAFQSCYNLTSVCIYDIAKWCNITFGNYSANPICYAKNLYLIKDGSPELITDLVIPESVTTIGNYAFSDCSNLTSVTIGNSVTIIGYRAFDSCYNLTDVYYTGSEADWAKITIGSDNSYLTRANLHYNYVPEE